MSELMNTTKLVKNILLEDVEARNSDIYLFQKVDERIYPGIMEMRYGYVLKHRKDFGLPAYETIRRARQKLQHEFPELSAAEAVKEERARLEDEYFDFALSEVDI